MGIRWGEFLAKVPVSGWAEQPALFYERFLSAIDKRHVISYDVYCRPPGFTVMPSGKYLAGGLQSGCTANSTGAQYKLNQFVQIRILGGTCAEPEKQRISWPVPGGFTDACSGSRKFSAYRVLGRTCAELEWEELRKWMEYS